MSVSRREEQQSVTSTSLLERLHHNQSEAWCRFVQLYCPLVYDACRRYRLQPSDAADITQEVLKSVASGIAGFKKQRESDSFRGWLYRIVQNKVRDHYRRAKNLPRGVGGTDFKVSVEQLPDQTIDESTSDAAQPDPALGRALELIRGEFQEPTWTAFWRLTVEGHRASDIAADLGMNANAVRQAKFRVLQRLRAEFADLIELPD